MALSSFGISNLYASMATTINGGTAANLSQSSSSFYDAYIGAVAGHRPPTPVQQPENTLVLIKKSVKEIKTEAVSNEAQTKIKTKIDRLLDCGALAQAMVLDAELRVRQKLYALSEWDYKVLPSEAIGEFESENRMTATKDGLKVHVDPLERYIGNPQSGEAKDRIIPDAVLDKLGEAKERKLFDTFSILWVEKVKDPLLLGQIDGCKDYFFVCEWGEDIKFDDIMKQTKPE